jgi:hypothetical protein
MPDDGGTFISLEYRCTISSSYGSLHEESLPDLSYRIRWCLNSDEIEKYGIILGHDLRIFPFFVVAKAQCPHALL